MASTKRTVTSESKRDEAKAAPEETKMVTLVRGESKTIRGPGANKAKEALGKAEKSVPESEAGYWLRRGWIRK